MSSSSVIPPNITRQALGRGSITKRTCRTWFQRFCPIGFQLKDLPRSGYPTEVDPKADSDPEQFQMSEKSFDDVCRLEVDIRNFFEAQLGCFYKDGNHSLLNKWRIVADNNGDYIEGCLFRGLEMN